MTTPGPRSIISLQQVSRLFRSGEALREVQLEVTTPQVIGIVGRNGAGKSTLLRLLPPLIHATAGQVRVLGVDPWSDPTALRERIGYMADTDQIPAGVRARDLLELCAGVYQRWDSTLVQRFQRRLGIDVNAPFSSLSRGMQRQVSLLMAIGHRPELLILDEPAGHLDPAVRKEVLGVLIELLNEAGTTVLLATHLLSDLERLAERLVILNQGRIVHDGALDAVTSHWCRVELPLGEVDQGLLTGVPGYVEHEVLGDRIVLVLHGSPAAASAILSLALGRAVPVTDIHRLNLEDAFIYATRPESAVPGPGDLKRQSAAILERSQA